MVKKEKEKKEAQIKAAGGLFSLLILI